MKKISKSVMACTAIAFLSALPVCAQTVDYSVPTVPQESGFSFTRISSDNDYVYMPAIKRGRGGLGWASNHVLDISTDGKYIAFISQRGSTSNIFIKDVDKQGASTQRTNRSAVQDFSFSPDGKTICFSETVGQANNIYLTDAHSGFVCRQITSGSKDYSPVYSAEMSKIFFSRTEGYNTSIWSYDVKNNFLSSYTFGMNPFPASKEDVVYCARINGLGKSEIYRVNYSTGIEECVVSDAERSFSSPQLSPNGQWLLFVGSSKISTAEFDYWNTDIYVCRTDGSQFTQLTFHAADDLSPVWSKGGNLIYFISQRGSADGNPNIWRMTFNL